MTWLDARTLPKMGLTSPPGTACSSRNNHPRRRRLPKFNVTVQSGNAYTAESVNSMNDRWIARLRSIWPFKQKWKEGKQDGMSEHMPQISEGSDACAADTENFNYDEELIQVRQLTEADLRATADGRFVAPTGEWHLAVDRIRLNRVLVILGEAGTGRRTAALWLLSKLCGTGQLTELEPIWKQPRIDLFPPATSGGGYLLDMPEPPAVPPHDDFGGQLLDWAERNDVRLIVTATPEAWVGRWTADASCPTARLRSPDARSLVESELRTLGAYEKAIVLNSDLLAPIWQSSPKACDAWRLARIIALADPMDAEKIAGEHEHWRAWINDEFPEKLDARTVMWSCAFCDGGYRESVMQMAKALHEKLISQERTPLEILSGSPLTVRLRLGKVAGDADRVRLLPDHHGLAMGVRRHLWEEFEGHRDVLREWMISQVKDLSPEDSNRVVDAVLDLVIQYHDDKLLSCLGKVLAIDRRTPAIETFSQAALDPRSGTYMRNRLYTWLDSASPEVIGFIAEVCGGPFGGELPDMALIRLRRAAQKSPPGNTALANGFISFAAQHPRLLLEAIHTWFTQPAQQTAGINAFLALASPPADVKLLFPDSPLEQENAVSTADLASYLHAAIAQQASQETAIAVLETWGQFVAEGVLPEDPVIDVAAHATAPLVQSNVITRLLPDIPEQTLKGKIYNAAMKIATSTSQTGNA